MTTVSLQALQKLREKSREGMPKEATSENGHRWCGRDMLGQTVPSRGSSNREGPITDSGQPCTTDIYWQWGSRPKVSPGLVISRVLEPIGTIRRCCPVQKLVYENSKLELDLLRCSQPLQLAEEQSDVVRTWHSIHTFHMPSLLCHLYISLPLSHTPQEKTCYLLTYESENNFCEQWLNKKPLMVRPSFSSSDLCI